MSNLRLAALGAAFAVAVSCGPAAAETAWAPRDRLEMVYDVVSGARIVELTLEFAVVGDTYQIASRQASVGVVRWLFPWQSRTDVEGRFAGASTQPSTYRVKGEFRGKPRSVEMDFRDGTLVRNEAVPENRDDERDEVTQEQLAGAIDPISAIMAVIRQINEGRGCTSRHAAFDGRMRFDIVFEDKGRRDLPRATGSIFEGAAELCEFTWIPIAGRSRRATANRNPETENRTGRVFMAPLGERGVLAPARIEFETWFGTVVGNLREVRGLPQKASAE